MRTDLNGMLHPGETIVYDSDAAPETNKSSVFATELTLFLFLGSLFIIAIIATFIFGFAHGDSLSVMSAKTFAPFAWLAIIFVFIVLAHKKISSSLKLTSVVMTEKRLFMAPPAEFVSNVGWEGPKPVADIIFVAQLSAKKGELFGSPCLVFTSVNPFYRKISSDRLPLNKRYIPCANLDEAFESLPIFLKVPDMQFDESPVEVASIRHERAVRFLENRKTKLGQN